MSLNRKQNFLNSPFRVEARMTTMETPVSQTRTKSSLIVAWVGDDYYWICRRSCTFSSKPAHTRIVT